MKIYNVSREDQDNFALDSQRKANEATINNHFKKEIVEVKAANSTAIVKDEYIRPSTTLEGLSKLAPAFDNVSFM